MVIQEVMDYFSIADKVKCIITDNGSNVFKAFQEFGEKILEFLEDEGTFNYSTSVIFLKHAL